MSIAAVPVGVAAGSVAGYFSVVVRVAATIGSVHAVSAFVNASAIIMTLVYSCILMPLSSIVVSVIS